MNRFLPACPYPFLVVVAFSLAPMSARAGDLERAPIHYSTAPVNNSVSRLQALLDSGKASLAFGDRFGYLPSLLDSFKVPRSSQTLVFSKTSMQRSRIAPETPRAIYFNDQAYIGYCQRGQVLEIAAVDPNLGAVFYTLDQKRAARPRFRRQDDTCLICHGSSHNQGLPGHLLRSLYVDDEGIPILSSGSYRIDQTSPYKQRWGGWYVTGTHKPMTHLGNLVVRDRRQPEEIDNSPNLNLTDLGGRLHTGAYLTPHSDIVALMVLEHQAEMHNRITRAGFLTRIALYDEAEYNKTLGQNDGTHSDLTRRRIKSACEPLVKYLLFSGEPRLPGKVQGTSDFAREFPRQGPGDSRGRSLRDLDLQTRLFKYPCSYLIYSEAFEALPAEARAYVMKRLWEVLNQEDPGNDFNHLSAADCRAIREILLATRRDLPASWRAGPP